MLDRSRRALRGKFPTHRIFDLSGLLEKSCSSPDDRIFLYRRLNSYLNGRRRGSFKLPARFNELRTYVSGLTKGQVRGLVYLVRPSPPVERPLPKWAFDRVREAMPATLWSTVQMSFDSCARTVDTNRLSKRDVPRSAGALWPSSPSFTEMLEISRRGKTCSGLWKPKVSYKTHLSARDVKDSPKIATRIVTNNIVGIRPHVSVPPKFLRWFRYRDGILFLTVRYNVPIGLVRFLLGQWIRNPFNLWLRVNCRFKYYLKLQEPPSKDGDPDSSEADYESSERQETGSSSPLLAPFVATTDEDQIFADQLAALLTGRRS